MYRRKGKEETDGYLENIPVEKLSTGENPDYGTKTEQSSEAPVSRVDLRKRS